MRVLNVEGLESVGKENIVIIGKVGAKKKMEIIKKATELKLKILNLGKGVKINATK
jgi:ribosomal protein L32E